LFRNIRHARRFAIDIGGSLAKLAYSSSVPPTRTSAADVAGASSPVAVQVRVCACAAHTCVKELNGGGTLNEHDVHLHFVKFETAHIHTYLEFVSRELRDAACRPHPVLSATGGGAHKYKQLLESTLGLKCVWPIRVI
jgi:type II pantothenate kinase